MNHHILRLPNVRATTGLSRGTLYLRVAQVLFTHAVSLGGRALGWPAFEVASLNAARIAGKSDAQMREFGAGVGSRPQAVA